MEAENFFSVAGFHASLVMVGKSRGFPPGNNNRRVREIQGRSLKDAKTSKTFSPFYSPALIPDLASGRPHQGPARHCDRLAPNRGDAKHFSGKRAGFGSHYLFHYQRNIIPPLSYFKFLFISRNKKRGKHFSDKKLAESTPPAQQPFRKTMTDPSF
jgi:hypothetical protein